MTAGQILAAAADHIERYGWRQDSLTLSDKARCAVTALGEVSWGRDMVEARRKAGLALAIEISTEREREHLGYLPNFIIAAWNDRPHRTKEEVVAALRNAKRHLDPADV